MWWALFDILRYSFSSAIWGILIAIICMVLFVFLIKGWYKDATTAIGRIKCQSLLIRYLIVLGVFIYTSSVKAEDSHFYRTSEIERLITKLKINVDSIHEGINTYEIGKRQVKLVFTGGQVTFVGYHLFSNEMKTMVRTPILNFLERYFLQLDYPTSNRPRPRMLNEDRFNFVVGSLQTVASLRIDDAFSFSLENNRYLATWTRNNLPVLSVSFPAEHELISGENKVEAEAHVETDILLSPLDSISSVNEALLMPAVQQGYFIRKGGTYIKDLFASDLFYHRNDSSLYLITDSSHPLESAANLMLSAECQADCMLDVRQVMYGFKKKQFSVPLRNWITYCVNNGCELYFGAEFMDEQEIRATVIAVNVAEGYDHVLFVTIPMTIIENGRGDIEAQLEAFIPMHNVKGLFAKYQKTNSKQSKIYIQ